MRRVASLVEAGSLLSASGPPVIADAASTVPKARMRELNKHRVDLQPRDDRGLEMPLK